MRDCEPLHQPGTYRLIKLSPPFGGSLGGTCFFVSAPAPWAGEEVGYRGGIPRSRSGRGAPIRGVSLWVCHLGVLCGFLIPWAERLGQTPSDFQCFRILEVCVAAALKALLTWGVILGGTCLRQTSLGGRCWRGVCLCGEGFLCL